MKISNIAHELKNFGLSPKDWLLTSVQKQKIQFAHKTDKDIQLVGLIKAHPLTQKVYIQDLSFQL